MDPVGETEDARSGGKASSEEQTPSKGKPSAEHKPSNSEEQTSSKSSLAEPKSSKSEEQTRSKSSKSKSSAESKSSNSEEQTRSKSSKSKSSAGPKSSIPEERTRLLDSSSSANYDYGGMGIAVSFAERSESFPSPDFKMDSVGKDSLGEEELKRKLKYFFMNPIDKWYAKRKFPWKLTFQIVKILFVSLQLLVFGTDGYNYELQKHDTGSSFRHMLLKDWTSVRDVLAYPPSIGPYAVYTKTDFFENVDHVIQTYGNIKNVALGTYCYDGPNCTMTVLSFCRKEFKKMVEFNTTVNFDSEERTVCHEIPSVYPEGDARWQTFSIKSYLATKNDSISFDHLIKVDIQFTLKTIFLKPFGKSKYPDCFSFQITVKYDNKAHDGQVLVNLDADTVKIKCFQNGPMNPDNKSAYVARQVINGFTMGVCTISLLLCLRCLAKARYLCHMTDKHFRVTQNKGLCPNEKLEFLDVWYCVMIFNDALIIAASILKAAIEMRSVESDQYATCAILLGCGNFLVWAGILRYLQFFSKYNILILTMKKAIPNVLRFTLCCILLYSGFVFCGWVVLGPYHIKFRSLSTTSECLFAMMNGDDLFATFAITNTNNALIWWFSRVYLYTFISMFIYVVISLFISVIMDSYETVKDYYRHGEILTRIQVLVSDYPEDSCSSFYQQRRQHQRTVLNLIIDGFRRMRDTLNAIQSCGPPPPE